MSTLTNITVSILPFLILNLVLTAGTLIAILLSEVQTNPFRHPPTMFKVYVANIFGFACFAWTLGPWLGPFGLPFSVAFQGWFLHRFIQQEFLKTCWWSLLAWGFFGAFLFALQLIQYGPFSR